MADGCAETNISSNKINVTPAVSCTGKIELKYDAINLSILIVLASAIGIYLIATTVLISGDGVSYIKQAQELAAHPSTPPATNAPGYPFLIIAAGKLAGVLGDEPSTLALVYPAQVVTLLCRILTLIPLYFIGKLLVGSRKSLYAIVILILLPHPAKMACELTREWVYMLFLATGFLLLLWGARRGLWWTFGLAGLSAGIGYWIRPECGQLVVYGSAWLVLALIRPGLGKICRARSLLAWASLLVAFAALALPYMKYMGHVGSPNAILIFRPVSVESTREQIEIPADNVGNMCLYSATAFSLASLKALGEVFRTVGENLMWFFVPPLLAGLYHRIREHAGLEERFLLINCILINVGMMVCRYCYIERHISNRWSLPLVAFTSFYIWDGLQIIDRRISGIRRLSATRAKKSHLPSILLVIGIVICLPKLMRPAGDDKRGYRTAAKWLKDNTKQQDVVAVRDYRISFYAERKGVEHRDALKEGADYAVMITEGSDTKPEIERSMRLEASMWVNEDRKTKKISIWKLV
jgi:hypothetical protein